MNSAGLTKIKKYCRLESWQSGPSKGQRRNAVSSGPLNSKIITLKNTAFCDQLRQEMEKKGFHVILTVVDDMDIDRMPAIGKQNLVCFVCDSRLRDSSLLQLASAQAEQVILTNDCMTEDQCWVIFASYAQPQSRTSVYENLWHSHISSSH